ncbi:MAG: 2-octaprenyl-6-methoxyphenyl hydroxylase [Pseudohongiellaceae bacterium]
MRIQLPNKYYDVVVVGGGMVGASFACALRRELNKATDKHRKKNKPNDERKKDSAEISILVVEAVDQANSPGQASITQPSFDTRSTALSYGSSQILEALGLWQQLSDTTCPIKEIHVSDRGRIGTTRLHHEDHQVDALGYVVENRELGVVLNTVMESATSIHLFCPASISAIKATAAGMDLVVKSDSLEHSISTSLVVLADGGRSPICEQLGIEQQVQDYEQHALIANIGFEKMHRNIAFERFTDTGPLAILPLKSLGKLNRASLVWTLTAQQSAEYMVMAEEELLEILQERFGNRLGKLLHIGEKFCYPLRLSVAREQLRPGLVLLGNVAHTLHPVAGQGLNLALRDVAALASTLRGAVADGADLGSMDVLQQYICKQEFDQKRTIMFTDTITRLFSSNSQGKILARKFGLITIDLMPSIKQGFAEQAMGLSING